MSGSPIRWIGTATAACALSASGTALVGCDAVSKLAGIQAPGAEMIGVDLVKNPNTNKIMRWACYEWFGSSTCQLAGWDSKPGRDAMTFSFDLGFDLSNPNEDIAIPLVEILMGLLVFDGDDLGAVCVSFCNPDEEECEPSRNAEGACSLDDAKEVDQASDLVPSSKKALDIAKDVASGTPDENNSFRVVPPKGSIEGHVQFDIDVDTIFNIMEDLIVNAVSNGSLNNLLIPYETEGNLFFNVPRFGRYAFGYGPWEDEWAIQ